MSAAKKILIAEDSQELLAQYSEVLTKAGYAVVPSKDGSDALFRLQNAAFDLIITDIRMPRLTGDKMVEELLAKNANSKTPIIIASGFIDDSILEKLKSEKRVHFLTKPVAAEDLLKKVNSVMPRGGGGVDVRFINPFITGALEVVSPAFLAPLVPAKPRLRDEKEISGDISAIVGFVSKGFKGNIALSFFESSYFKVVSKSLGAEISELNADARDAIGEIIRLVFEKAKDAFDKQSIDVKMTSPSVVADKGHMISYHSGMQTIVIMFENENKEGFRVEICTV